MNFLEMCQRVREEAGVSGVGPTSVVGQQGQLQKIVGWVASAWIELQLKRSDWDFMWRTLSFDTTIGQDTYSSGMEGVKRIRKVKIYDKLLGSQTESILSEVGYDEMDTHYKLGIPKSGRPVTYSVRPDGSLMFDMVPDREYVVKISYYEKPQPITANLDEPSLPEEYRMLIVYMALRKFSAHYESAIQYSDFKEEMKDLLINLERSQLPELTTAGPLVR